MSTTFESAYKTLQEAQAAAKEAARRGLETSDVEDLDLARENLIKASKTFCEALEQSSVQIKSKGGMARLLRAEFEVLEKLAKDNDINITDIFGRVLVEHGRIFSAYFENLELINISALSALTNLENLRLNGNRIVDASPLTIANFAKLKFLHLSSNPLLKTPKLSAFIIKLHARGCHVDINP